MTIKLQKKNENQEIGHVFHDPITIYMEEFFITGGSSASHIFYDLIALCCQDRNYNQFLVPLQALILIFVKNSEGAKVLD